MPEGFFQYGHVDTDLSDSTYEDFLVADRPGLEHLRAKIDEVLSGSDEVTFDDDVITDLNGIRVARYTAQPSQTGEASGRLAIIGCLAILVIALALAFLGTWKLYELVTQP